MKRISIAFFAGAILIAACNNDSKTTEEKTDSSATASLNPPEEAWVPVDSATMMQKMMEYGTPGPMHKMMASWNGSWTGDMSMWHDASSPVEKATTTEVNSMILDGKYQMSKHTGNMMGMPFEGMSIMAYDNATKSFHSTWVDNMSTGIMTMQGNWDEATKTITQTGKTPDIFHPGKECTYRQTYKVIDDNNITMEMYGPDPQTGKEFKMMELKMTRKK